MPEKRMAVMAVALAVGILAGDYAGLAGCALIAGSAVLVGLLIVPAGRRAALLLVAAVAMCGALRYAADRSVAPDDVSQFCHRVTAIEGTVASDVGGAPDAKRMTFRVRRARIDDEWRTASGDVMVTLYLSAEQKPPQLEYGDSLRLLVRPYVPFEPTNPGQFSWKDYLARHGIYACASVRDHSRVTILRRSRAGSIIAAALDAKQYLISSIQRVHSPKIASVMSGVVLGTYAYLDEDTLRDFTRTGTMHVLAASGFNCVVLLIIIAPLLRLLRVFPRYKAVVMMLAIAFYLLMVGPVPSLVRAAIMAVLVLLAAPLRRVPDYANLFYVAGFVVLLVSPSYLFDIGFQLSFAAVWGLIAVAPVLETLLGRTSMSRPAYRPRWRFGERWIVRAARQVGSWSAGKLAAVGVATAAVSLVTAPIVAYYFNYISLVSLPANLAVAFAVPLVFADSFLSLVTAHIPHCAGWIGGIGTASTQAMLSSVDYLGSMRYSAVAMRSPGVLAIVGYCMVLYAAASCVGSKNASR